MRDALQNAVMKAVDWSVAAFPRRLPDKAALELCKLVAHRGGHTSSILENTMQAFSAAHSAGAWGIECDVRWTKDLVPIIHHDPTGQRLFADPAVLQSLTHAEIRSRLPLIPTLENVVSDFGGKLHLMLEIKAEYYPDAARQKAILQETLSALTPGRDFHFLMLDPALAAHVDFLPREFCVLVAELNLPRLSRQGIADGFGGMTGHYLLYSNAVRERHEQAGQHTGTGFINSENALFRELNRGIEWIFSDNALAVQAMLDRRLKEH